MSSRTYSNYKPNPKNPNFDTVLVPQGMEYKTVCDGMGKNSAKLDIIAIPAGIQPLTTFLQQWQQSPNFVNKFPSAIFPCRVSSSELGFSLRTQSYAT